MSDVEPSVFAVFASPSDGAGGWVPGGPGGPGGFLERGGVRQQAFASDTVDPQVVLGNSVVMSFVIVLATATLQQASSVGEYARTHNRKRTQQQPVCQHACMIHARPPWCPER